MINDISSTDDLRLLLIRRFVRPIILHLFWRFVRHVRRGMREMYN
jgi:hypothetical protein